MSGALDTRVSTSESRPESNPKKYHFQYGFQTTAKTKPQIITPKITENEVGEAIRYRSDIQTQFKDLGQPDLVCFTKYDKSIKHEVGEYHYTIGIDLSSQIQPFMYLQTIELNDKSEATIKHPKVATYCSYNIFSKGDLRIRCTFPSSASPLVQFYPSNPNQLPFNLSNDSRDEKTKQLWNECYVSSIIRLLLFSDDLKRQLPGMCKYNPLQSTKDIKQAITLLCSFLPRGHLVGCQDIFNKPSHINNFLVDALLKLLSITHYYDFAIEQLNSMRPMHDFSILAARIMVLKGDISKAIKIMHDSLSVNPRDGWMLNEQVQLLSELNRPDLAFLPALKAIESLPTEYVPWKNLVEVYILKKDFKNALLALNSAPMYVNRKKDIFPALNPKQFDFPDPVEGEIPAVWQSSAKYGSISGVGDIVEFSTSEEVKTICVEDLQVYEETKLNATFKESYDLLAIMSKQIGWIELLKLRANIFVMEDEYNEVSSETSRANSTIGKSNSDSSTNISNNFKSKRLSEKWLDSLFIIFYSNLKRVLIWRNEIDASKVNGKTLNISALQWELIGDEFFKAHYFREGFLPLIEALNQRYSIFAALKLLRYYLNFNLNNQTFVELHLVNDDDHHYTLDNDFVLQLCLKTISWNAKHYGEFPLICLQTLRLFIDNEIFDSDVIKSKAEFMCDGSITGVVERYIGWLDQFQD